MAISSRVFKSAFKTIPIDDILTTIPRFLSKQADDVPIKPFTPESFPNLRRFSTQTPSAVEAPPLNKLVVELLNEDIIGGGKWNEYSELINRIELGLADERIAPLINKNLAKVLVDEGQAGLIKQLSVQIDDAQKIKFLQDKFKNHQENINTPSGWGQSVETLLDDQLRSMEMAFNNQENYFQNRVKRIMLSKHQTKGKQYITDFSINPQDMYKNYGNDHYSILSAMLDGDTQYLKSDISKDFVETMRTEYTELYNRLSQYGIPLSKDMNKNLNPFNVPKDITRILGQEEVTHLLRTHTNLNEEAISSLINSYNSVANSVDSFLHNPVRSSLDFKSGKDAIEFFSKVRAWNQTTNGLVEYIGAHKQRMKSLMMYSFFGSNPEKTLVRAFDLVTNSVQNRKQNIKVIKSFLTRLKDYGGNAFTHTEGVRAMGNVISQFTGLALGAPSRAVIRNLLIDFAGHATAVADGLTNRKIHIGSAAKGALSDLQYLITHAVKGKSHRKEVDRLLGIMDFANSMDSFANSSLQLTEDITDTTSKYVKMTNKYLNKFVTGLSNLTANLYKISGNNSLIDSRRTRSLISLQQLWSSHFENFKGYQEWFEAMSKQFPERMRQFESTYDIDKNVWEFLKLADRVDLSPNKKYPGGLSNIPNFLTRESIIETSNDIANKFKNRTETASQFKERVSKAWQSMIYNTLMDDVPVPTYTDSISALHTSRHPLIYIGLKGVFKFGDIANAQFANVKKRIARSIYGDTSQYIGFDKSMYQYMMSYSKYLAFAYGVWITKDIIGNRKPTNFRQSPEKILQLMVSTGYAGYINMMLTNMFQIYGDAGTGIWTGTPGGGGQDRIGRVFKSALSDSPDKWFKVAKATSQLAGYPQVWFAKGATDYMLRSWLLTPSQDYRYERQLKKYGSESILKRNIN